MHGGMQVSTTEIAAINVQLKPHGYSATHVKLSSKVEDLNDDGRVDRGDLGMLLSAWGNNNIWMDVNGDGKVDGADRVQLLAAWGAYTMTRNVPVPVPVPVVAPVKPTVNKKI